MAKKFSEIRTSIEKIADIRASQGLLSAVQKLTNVKDDLEKINLKKKIKKDEYHLATDILINNLCALFRDTYEEGKFTELRQAFPAICELINEYIKNPPAEPYPPTLIAQFHIALFYIRSRTAEVIWQNQQSSLEDSVARGIAMNAKVDLTTCVTLTKELSGKPRIEGFKKINSFSICLAQLFLEFSQNTHQSDLDASKEISQMIEKKKYKYYRLRLEQCMIEKNILDAKPPEESSGELTKKLALAACLAYNQMLILKPSAEIEERLKTAREQFAEILGDTAPALPELNAAEVLPSKKRKAVAGESKGTGVRRAEFVDAETARLWTRQGRQPVETDPRARELAQELQALGIRGKEEIQDKEEINDPANWAEKIKRFAQGKEEATDQKKAKKKKPAEIEIQEDQGEVVIKSFSLLPDALIEEIIRALKKNCIRNLDLHNCRIPDKLQSELIIQIFGSKKIQSANLANTGLTERTGGILMACALQYNFSLRSLNLAGNTSLDPTLQTKIKKNFESNSASYLIYDPFSGKENISKRKLIECFEKAKLDRTLYLSISQDNAWQKLYDQNGWGFFTHHPDWAVNVWDIDSVISQLSLAEKERLIYFCHIGAYFLDSHRYITFGLNLIRAIPGNQFSFEVNVMAFIFMRIALKSKIDHLRDVESSMVQFHQVILHLLDIPSFIQGKEDIDKAISTLTELQRAQFLLAHYLYGAQFLTACEFYKIPINENFRTAIDLTSQLRAQMDIQDMSSHDLSAYYKAGIQMSLQYVRINELIQAFKLISEIDKSKLESEDLPLFLQTCINISLNYGKAENINLVVDLLKKNVDVTFLPGFISAYLTLAKTLKNQHCELEALKLCRDAFDLLKECTHFDAIYSLLIKNFYDFLMVRVKDAKCHDERISLVNEMSGYFSALPKEKHNEWILRFLIMHGAEIIFSEKINRFDTALIPLLRNNLDYFSALNKLHSLGEFERMRFAAMHLHLAEIYIEERNVNLAQKYLEKINDIIRGIETDNTVIIKRKTAELEGAIKTHKQIKACEDLLDQVEQPDQLDEANLEMTLGSDKPIPVSSLSEQDPKWERVQERFIVLMSQEKYELAANLIKKFREKLNSSDDAKLIHCVILECQARLMLGQISDVNSLNQDTVLRLGTDIEKIIILQLGIFESFGDQFHRQKLNLARQLIDKLDRFSPRISLKESDQELTKQARQLIEDDKIRKSSSLQEKKLPKELSEEDAKTRFPKLETRMNELEKNIDETSALQKLKENGSEMSTLHAKEFSSRFSLISQELRRIKPLLEKVSEVLIDPKYKEGVQRLKLSLEECEKKFLEIKQREMAPRASHSKEISAIAEECKLPVSSGVGQQTSPKAVYGSFFRSQNTRSDLTLEELQQRVLGKKNICSLVISMAKQSKPMDAESLTSCLNEISQCALSIEEDLRNMYTLTQDGNLQIELQNYFLDIIEFCSEFSQFEVAKRCEMVYAEKVLEASTCLTLYIKAFCFESLCSGYERFDDERKRATLINFENCLKELLESADESDLGFYVQSMERLSMELPRSEWMGLVTAVQDIALERAEAISYSPKEDILQLLPQHPQYTL